MDIGDLGYLIFLAIVAVANLIRNVRKNRDKTQAPAKPEQRRQRGIPKPAEARREPQEADEGQKEDHWKRMVEDLFGDADPEESQTEEGPSTYRRSSSRAPSKPVAKAKLQEVRADGYREGETLTEFAERIRREGRIKLEKRHLEGDTSNGQEGIDFDFDPRHAVIYDAIWKRPFV